MQRLVFLEDDPAFLESLGSLGEHQVVARELADWLEDRGDRLAEFVRQLAMPPVAVPEGAPDAGHDVTADGGGFRFLRGESAVVARFTCSRLAYRLGYDDGEERLVLRVSGRRSDAKTAERLRVACERWRANMILKLFGISRRLLGDRLAIRREQSMERVAEALARCGGRDVPFLEELGHCDPDRFARIMKLIWSRQDLRPLRHAVASYFART